MSNINTDIKNLQMISELQNITISAYNMILSEHKNVHELFNQRIQMLEMKNKELLKEIEKMKKDMRKGLKNDVNDNEMHEVD